MNWFSELIHNPFLVIPVLSWLCAQVLKTVIHSVINRKFDITRLSVMEACHRDIPQPSLRSLRFPPWFTALVHLNSQ